MTTMTSMTSDKPTLRAQEIIVFLADYGAWLLGCGATCIRLEKNVHRIANAFGLTVEIIITPRHIHLSTTGQDYSEPFTITAPTKVHATDFEIITQLSRLSWEVADKGPDFKRLKSEFHSITNNNRQSKWLVLFLVTLANASFCRLFGGDLTAMSLVAVATLAGYYLKQCLIDAKTDIRRTVLICSFVSSILGSTDYLFSLGSTPAITIGTSILYLIPGIPYLNSFSDLLYRYYICSFSRFMDAIVMTACLSIGLCAGMILMNIGMF